MNTLLKSLSKKERNTLVKDSLKTLEKIPLVCLVIKRNKELEKENRALEKTIIRLCLEFAERTSTSKADPVPEEDDFVEIIEPPAKENIIYTIDDDTPQQVVIDSVQVKIKVEPGLIETTAVEFVEEDVFEEVEVEEEEVEVEDEEEEEEEEVEEEVVVDEEEEEEEEVEEEVVVDEEEEEEEEEVEVFEEEEDEVDEVVEEVEEVELDEVVEEEEQEDEVYEIQIKGKSYYVTNEVNSTIYEADSDGDISIEAGIFKNGKPVFYKK